jgi:hypothetical protein
MRHVLLWLAAVLLALPAGPASAQTMVSGPVVADTRWTVDLSPYVVTADVVVQGGATLTIDAGVVVSMSPGTKLTVQAGALRVPGTAASPVRVQSERTRLGQPAAPGDWDQWVFGPGTTAATRLDHVRFEHGRGLAVLGSAPVLNHLDIRQQQGAAITIDLAASPSGVGNRASDNGLNGIAVPPGTITATTRWGLRGIPYVVAGGTVSVGAAPSLGSVSPANVEQGQTLTLTVNGSRLAGATAATLDRPGLTLTPLAGGTAAQARFQLSVAANAALGPASLRLQVDAGELSLPNAVTVTPPLPAITSLTPATVLAGTGPSTITLGGRNFLAASVVTANAADLPTEFVSATQLRAQLPQQTEAGTLQFQVRSPNAQQPSQPLLSNLLPLAVQMPVPPVLAVEPTPLALPPDGVQRGFQVALNRADFRDHTVSVASDHPAIAAVSPASATIAAGQTRATFQVRGLATGQTTLRFTSPTLGSLAVPVFVTVDYAGINTATAAVVGVQFDTEPVPPAPVAAGAYSAHVGLTFGASWIDSAPRGVIRGNALTLTLSGVDLPANLAVAIQPPEGVVLGAVSVSADGSTATVPVNVAADAAPGLRRLVASTGSQVLAPAVPEGDRFSVRRELPEITSVQPILGLPGSTVSAFIVRGRHLFDAAPLQFSGAGITAASSPQVNADGTELGTSITIAADAAPGPRIVTVATPSGDSGTVAGSANTFSVVQQAGPTFSGLQAAVVGVVLDAPVTPVPPGTLGLLSAEVGVGLGPVVNIVQPGTGATGQDLVLTLTGSELAGVTAATLSPPLGVTLGTPVPAADGLSVQLPVSIAADAPLTVRRLQLLAGTAAVATAPGGDRFTVVAPVPVLASLQPLVAPVGTSVALTVRGANLQNVTQLRVTPSAGITVSPPAYNAADPLGPSLSVTLLIDAAAAPGARVVTAVAPAGESSSEPGPTNTFTLSAAAGATYAALSSVYVGVELAGDVVPVPPQPLVLHSSDVGVELATEPSPPASQTLGLQAAQVGVTFGPVVTSMAPTGLSPGQGGTLVVQGIGLPADAVVAFQPATGIVLEGPPTVSADGSQLVQPISIAADAPLQGRAVVVSSGAGLVPTAPLGNTWFSVAGAPQIVSLSPILGRQGEVVTLTVRGTQLQPLLDVVVEPADGLQVVPGSTAVAADGSQVEVRIAVAPDAPLGARVIRVRTRSGTTAAEAAAANTFTIFPP